MSRNTPAPRAREPIASHVRPLPSAPSLELERKHAKTLLKQLRVDDADAIARVRAAHAQALRDRSPNELRLADVQHVIAREYGFTSWPRLVEYFEELERHRNGARHNSSNYAVDHLEGMARSTMRRHQQGDTIVARELAHFVPRFYGRPLPEILATPMTEDDARLVVAREHLRASWDELVERSSVSRAERERWTWEGTTTPEAEARRAIEAYDTEALGVLIDAHPELLTPSATDREWRRTLASLAVSSESKAKTVDARRVTEYLVSRGVDIQHELNERLLGFLHDMEHRAERVRWYLERGADPKWMPPNGITVLEHALVRYRDAEGVDLIVQRVRPPRALWIAAGIGDVAGVRRYIAGKGVLTPAGRINRPDLVAMGAFPPGLPPNHDADDREIMWEAFQIAGWNSRWATMDVLLDAGLPVDHAPIGWPLMLEAVGNMMLPLVEYLVRHGADLDREWPVHGSARTLARSRVAMAHDPRTDAARRLLAVCNAGTIDELLAASDAKRQSPPPPEARTLRAMQLAADDAARQGQASVTTENIVVGILRLSGGLFASFFKSLGVDMVDLRTSIGARLLPDVEPFIGQSCPADPGTEAAVRAAGDLADRRRRKSVGPLHLLSGIVSRRDDTGARLLIDAGLDEALIAERLDSSL